MLELWVRLGTWVSLSPGNKPTVVGPVAPSLVFAFGLTLVILEVVVNTIFLSPKLLSGKTLSQYFFQPIVCSPRLEMLVLVLSLVGESAVSVVLTVGTATRKAASHTGASLLLLEVGAYSATLSRYSLPISTTSL